MSMSTGQSKADMTPEERRAQEELEFKTGPLSVLRAAVKNSNQILVNCRNNRKLLARIKAFDRHCNMVLENVKELWTDIPRSAKTAGTAGKRKAVNRERYIPKMFLRGDSVILVVRNTGAASGSNK